MVTRLPLLPSTPSCTHPAPRNPGEREATSCHSSAQNPPKCPPHSIKPYNHPRDCVFWPTATSQLSSHYPPCSLGPIHTGSLLFLECATACSHPGLLSCLCQELLPLPYDSCDSSGSLYKCHLSSEAFPCHPVENKTTRPQLPSPVLTVFSPQPFSSCVLFTAYLFAARLSLLSSVWMGTLIHCRLHSA